jgi:hypothetical protein
MSPVISSRSNTLFGSDSLIVGSPSDAGDDTFTSIFVGSAIFFNRSEFGLERVLGKTTQGHNGKG